MAFQQEAIGKLWEELHRGHNLSAKLLALVSHPLGLDSRGWEMAVAISQELPRVFRASLLMLNPGDSSRVADARAAAPPAEITEGSIGQPTPAKDKHLSGEEVTPPRIGKEEEITAEPYKDGYIWKKYGQKNIKDKKFARLYFRCMHSHERGCRAKKQVQQLDDSTGNPPMSKVTYLNEHTCHRMIPSVNIARVNLPATNTTTTTRNAAHFGPAPARLPQVGGAAELEDMIMASTFSTVIGGAAPDAPSSSSLPSPSPVKASTSDPASYEPGGGQSPTLMDLGMALDETMMEDMYLSCGSTFPPLEAPAAPSSLSSLPPQLLMEAISTDSAAYMPSRGGHSPSQHAMTTADVLYWSFPMFSPR